MNFAAPSVSASPALRGYRWPNITTGTDGAASFSAARNGQGLGAGRGVAHFQTAMGSAWLTSAAESTGVPILLGAAKPAGRREHAEPRPSLSPGLACNAPNSCLNANGLRTAQDTQAGAGYFSP